MSDLSNHRKKWTVKEVKQLMKEIHSIVDIEKIAKIHKRTSNGIYLKLVREAANIADEEPNIKLNELCDIVGLPASKLLEGFKKIKYEFDDDDSYDSDITDVSDDSNDSDDTVKNEVNNNDDISDTESYNIEDKKEIVYFSNVATGIIITINLLGLGYYLYKQFKL